jgi:Ran GTPase-activating protein (RanGAP) involved in mRNA processing and transport
MNRKEVSDDSGIIIAESLCRTRFLECIELSGNKMKVRAITALGKMLGKNRWLKKLDLEFNDLTDGNRDCSGIKVLADYLKKNITLISLNLNSCGLNEECSSMLANMMKYNDTLINLDVEGNP